MSLTSQSETRIYGASSSRVSRSVRRAAIVAIAAMASSFAAVGGGRSAVRAADPFVPVDAVPLGLVETFGVLGPAAVTNAAPPPVTVIRGDVGAGGALTGFPAGSIEGTRYTPEVSAMMTALHAAYNNAAGRPATATLAADLGGQTAGPGVHSSAAASGTAASGSFIIDGEGHPDAVFIFQIHGALALGANTTMTLINGAQAKNVFWQVVGAGTLGANTKFVGTLMASAVVDSGAGSTVNGRLTSLAAAITMSSTQLYSAPPSVSIDGSDAAYTTDSTPLITGTTSARSPMTVTITIDTVTQTPTATPSSTGAWSFQSPALINGVHVIVASSVDAVGNVGSATQTLTVDTEPPEVSIDGDATATTNDLSPTISGTTDIAAGQVVTIVFTRTTPAATITRTALVQADLTWNLSPNGLSAGEWTVVATVTDPAGNQNSPPATQALTIDITAPVVTIASNALTNDSTPSLSGSAEVGATVTVAIDGVDVTPVTRATGTWLATFAGPALVDGTHNIFVSATDVAGNTATTTQVLTVDTVAPAITILPGATDATTDLTPTIAGTTAAAPGVTVSVSIDGGTAMTGLVQSDGSWNVTPIAQLSAGSHTVVATVGDPAGNIGTGTQTITVSAPPQPPTTTQPPLTIPGADTAEFVSVGPKRVFDTRPGQSPDAMRTVTKTPIGGPVELRVQMTDLPGFVPASGVGAVSLNVISSGATANGYITVYACGSREVVSSVNFTAGHTVANAVITPVSASGAVCFYANTATDVIVDINGWFAAGAAFSAIGPKRVFDTRADSGSSVLRTVPATRVAAGGMLEVQLTDLPGYVPASGVAAVSLNVTVTNPEGSGFVTVYSCGTRALVSSVNYVAGQTVANAVIAPVSATGTVCFYSLAATDLIVDINGWLHAGSAFHGMAPARVLDTRAGNSPDALRDIPKVKIGGGNILEVRVTDLAGRVPANGVTAVSLNVTATNPEADGFITVFACGAIEEVSSLNYEVGATVANAVLAPVSATGTICLYSNAPSDVLVDINGWIGSAQAG